MADLEQDLRHLHLSVVTRTSREEAIGIGSYASVYEVTVHGTICAAKEMHPILVNEANKRSFLSECVQSSRILHPNVVQFLGIYYPSPRARLPWLVMELMHISLRGLIEKYEKEDFPFHFKLSILTDTCNGLQFLHSQNIIHRDLSSNNILLTKHLVAKISDLGMAKVIPPGLQRHTQAPGTVVFMPPEALSVNPQYGKPIDVFSVGCVCVHVISMEWPTPLDKIGARNVVLSEVQRRNQYLTKLAKYPSLERLVKQCLQDRPEQRPVIKEVSDGLKGINYNCLPHEDDNIIDLFTSAVKHSQGVQTAREDGHLLAELLQAKDHLRHQEDHLHYKDKIIFEKDQLIKQKDQEIMEKEKIITELRRSSKPSKVGPKEDFSHLPPKQQRKKLQDKVKELDAAVQKTLSDKTALKKMQVVYSQNPTLGDPKQVQSSLEVTCSKLDDLNAKLYKFKIWLHELEGKPPPDPPNYHLNDRSGAPPVRTTVNMNVPTSLTRREQYLQPQVQWSQYNQWPVSPEASTGYRANVLYDFAAHNAKELSVAANDVVIVIGDLGDGWLEVKRGADLGYVPASYVQYI